MISYTRIRKRADVSEQIKRKHAPMRKNAMTKEAGAQLVANKTQIAQSHHNKRTCLLDEMSALLPLEEKEMVYSAMVIDIPAEGDTSMFHIANALSNPGLTLEEVSGKYNRKGGRLITCRKRKIVS